MTLLSVDWRPHGIYPKRGGAEIRDSVSCQVCVDTSRRMAFRVQQTDRADTIWTSFRNGMNRAG